MTVIDTTAPARRPRPVAPMPRRRVDGGGVVADRPAPQRPRGAALPHRGTGVRMARASHRPRPVTPAATVALALVAAVITVWLGLVAQFATLSGGPSGRADAVPGQLGVVQVQPGETLAHLAARVAPDAPVGPVVERIRHLNKLDAATLDAGQTLIAPIG